MQPVRVFDNLPTLPSTHLHDKARNRFIQELSHQAIFDFDAYMGVVKIAHRMSKCTLASLSFMDGPHHVLSSLMTQSSCESLSRDICLCSLSCMEDATSIVAISNPLADDIRFGELSFEMVKSGFKFYARVGIFVKNVKVGVLFVLDTNSRTDFTAKDADMLMDLGGCISDIMSVKIEQMHDSRRFEGLMNTLAQQCEALTAAKAPLLKVNNHMQQLREAMDPSLAISALQSLSLDFLREVQYLGDTLDESIQQLMISHNLMPSYYSSLSLCSLSPSPPSTPGHTSSGNSSTNSTPRGSFYSSRSTSSFLDAPTVDETATSPASCDALSTLSKLSFSSS